MAIDKQIHELPLSTLEDTDLLIIQRETSPGVWADYSVLGSNSLGVNTQLFWVTPDGSNSTGTGSILNPWATISFAMSQITASAGNPAYICFYGIIGESSSISYKPNVHIIGMGEGAVIQSAGPMILDNSWGTTPASSVFFLNFSIQGSVTFDFTPFTYPYFSTTVFNMNNVRIAGTFTVAGTTNFGPLVYSFSSRYGVVYIDNAGLYSFGGDYFAFINMGMRNPGISGENSFGATILGAMINTIDFNVPAEISYTPLFSVRNSQVGSVGANASNCVVRTDLASLVENPILSNGAFYILEQPLSTIWNSISTPPIILTATSYTFDFTSNYYILNNTTAGSYTLPPAAGNSGRKLTIKLIGTGNMTLLPQGSDTIDPGLSFPISNPGTGTLISLSLFSDGVSNWYTE